MPERPEVKPLEELSPVKVERMAQHIFTHLLGADVKHLWSQEHSPTLIPSDSLGATNPQLQALQQEFSDDGTTNQEAVKSATNSYIEIREDFINGSRDEYGRAAWLNTVPTEFDSAAATVISDLERQDGDMVAEGELYKVFDSKFKTGRFDAANFFFQDDFIPDAESPSITGKKIMVPSSSYAGYYATIFVPDGGGNAFLWSNSPNSKATSDDFRENLKRTFDEFRINGRFTTEDRAKIYAIKVYCDLFDRDGSVKKMLQDVLSSDIGVPTPNDDDLKNFLDNSEGFTDVFKPADENFLEKINEKYARLTRVLPEGQQDILIPYSTVITPREFVDPGYLAMALDALTKPDTYQKWHAYFLNFLTEALETAKATDHPTKKDVDFHLKRYFNLSRLERIDIPWQAEFILGGEGYESLKERMKAIDSSPGFELEFSLLGSDNHGRRTYTQNNLRGQLAAYIGWISEAQEKLAQPPSGAN